MSGLYFEEFEVGTTYKHAVTLTVVETDNMMFTCLTMNTQPLHLDAHFAATTQHGKPLVNSIFTLGLKVGITVTDTTLGTTLGNLSMTNIRCPRPVFTALPSMWRLR
jgi:acyl dehydratase